MSAHTGSLLFAVTCTFHVSHGARAAALACINIRLLRCDWLCIRACNCLPDTCQPADVHHPHLHLACQPPRTPPLLHPFITLSGLSRHCLPPLLSFPCFLSSPLSPTLDGSLSWETICDVATNILTGEKRRRTETGGRWRKGRCKSADRETAPPPPALEPAIACVWLGRAVATACVCLRVCMWRSRCRKYI